jgi:glycosyltransferase involved in cell wall biosynthesis
MKIAYLIPENQYAFFRGIIRPLEFAGIDVAVNTIPADADLVLAGILPATSEWGPAIASRGKPFVLWHWDLYSFVDVTEPRWAQFLGLLPKAADVWSCTYETARQLKELREVDSYVMPAWVGRLEGLPAKDYVFYAASSAAFGKRVQWAEHACKMAGYPLSLSKGQSLPRERYLHVLAECRVYLMTAFEESNATIPAMEAAACGRAVVLADLPASREVFGDTAYYFPAWDFRALLAQLKAAWEYGAKPGCRERIVRNYGVDVVAKRIIDRLRCINATANG